MRNKYFIVKLMRLGDRRRFSLIGIYKGILFVVLLFFITNNLINTPPPPPESEKFEIIGKIAPIMEAFSKGLNLQNSKYTL